MAQVDSWHFETSGHSAGKLRSKPLFQETNYTTTGKIITIIQIWRQQNVLNYNVTADVCRIITLQMWSSQT